MSTKMQEKPVSKKAQNLDAEVELPEGVSAKFKDGQVTVTGPLGKVSQDFSKFR